MTKVPGQDDQKKTVLESVETIDLSEQLNTEKKRADQEKQRADSAESKLLEIEQKNKETGVFDFVEAMTEKGIILPAEKNRITAFMMQLEDTDINFSEGTGETSMPMSTIFREFVEKMTPRVPLTPLSRVDNAKDNADNIDFTDNIDLAEGEWDEDDLEKDRAARSIMQKKECDYFTALKEAAGGGK